MSGAAHEIERVWVLTAAPVIPAGAPTWRIEQGYLPEHGLDADQFAEGRIRRIQHDDGRVECLHTIKRGSGMVRQETERTVDAATFERLWPSTQGCRIRKIRHRVQHGGLIWEVDQFLDWPLWMAEVELPSESTPVTLPAWLQARWRNHALAMHGPPSQPRG